MKYDVIVIGAGPGGYVAAIRLGQLGKKTLVIEKKYVGGVCLNVGCIPTKALLHAAHLREQVEYASKQMGLHLKDEGFDITQINKWKTGIVTRLTKGIQTLWKTNGVNWEAGEAVLKSDGKVDVLTNSGEKKTYTADNVIIATGSSPVVLKGFEFDGERVWSSDDAVGFKTIPKKLVVLGAGAIGLEFAYLYSRFGSEVVVLELMPQILPGMDTEMANELEKVLKRKGIKIIKKVFAKSVERTKDGIEVVYKENEKEKKVQGDVLLVAVGRRPNSGADWFKDLGIKLDEKGFVKVDSERRTNRKGIFAIGDITGPPLLAHKASKEGVVAAEVISGLNSSFDPRAIPSVVYTEPQLASVGMTEEEAKSNGIDITVGKFPFLASGRALAYGESWGMAKIIADKSNDEILGIHILGPEASSLIGEGAFAIEMVATAEDLGLTIHPHPTLTEVLMEAAENIHKRAIHIPNR